MPKPKNAFSAPIVFALPARTPKNELKLYEIYNAMEMYDKAVTAFFAMEELRGLPMPSAEQARLRNAYREGGIRSFWEVMVESIPDKLPLHYRVAQHHARLGRTDNAFAHLQKAYDARDFDFILFLADPVFERLNSDPRYAEMTNLLLKQ